MSENGKTNKQVLIESGIPKEELDRIDVELDDIYGLNDICNHDIDNNYCAHDVLMSSFAWSRTPQGHRYWKNWHEYFQSISKVIE